jgi:type I restriction enzyme M protein
LAFGCSARTTGSSVTYVAQEDTREAIDIKKLNAEIAGIVARQNKLRKAIDEIVADIEEE